MTYILIAATVLSSIIGFSNAEVMYHGKHWPYAEQQRREYYRMLFAGFLHADVVHLLFNMMTLYFFGRYVESWFQAVFPQIGGVVFLLFYLVAVVAASLGTYYKHHKNPSFASIGASGAVSAVLFAAILLNPTMGISVFLIPIPVPGFIFGALYLWYSSYAANRSEDHIDHLAHFYGAVFGFLFPLVLQPGLILQFLAQLRQWIL
jgi:membrane associated rhomboid family serine protease